MMSFPQHHTLTFDYDNHPRLSHPASWVGPGSRDLVAGAPPAFRSSGVRAPSGFAASFRGKRDSIFPTCPATSRGNRRYRRTATAIALAPFLMRLVTSI